MSEANRMRNIVLRFDMRCATQSPNTLQNVTAVRWKCPSGQIETPWMSSDYQNTTIPLAVYLFTLGGIACSYSKRKYNLISKTR